MFGSVERSKNISAILVYLLAFLLNCADAVLQPDAHQSGSKNIDNVVVEILQQCFIGKGIDTVVTVGQTNSILLSSKSSLLNEVAVAVTEGPQDPRKRPNTASTIFHRGFPVFTVTVSDKYSAEQLFLNIKKTHWWDYTATYIILDCRTLFGGISCPERARELLLTTWKMDVLSSIFLCSIQPVIDGKEAESIFLYTYNPYKETAPSPWKRVETHVGPQGHPWTLFEQKYESDRTSCHSLKFGNKTMDLNGFKIAASVKPHGQRIVETKNNEIEDLEGCDSHIVRAICKQLNASMSLKTYGRNFEFGMSYDNGSTMGLVADLVNHKCDISLNVKYVMRQRNIYFTSVVSTTGLWIVTKHRGWKSSLERITDFLKVYIIVAVVIVCFVSVIITGYSATCSTSPDFMNVPRLVLSTSVSRLPTSTMRRLLLFATMFLVLVVNSGFQGKLAALVTIPTPKRQVDTIKDLKQLDYDIYAFEFIFEFIAHSRVERFHRTSENYIDNCDVLVNNGHSACIFDESEFNTVATNENLHVSEKAMFVFFESYATRTDWPLYDRFNTLVMRCFEGGLIHHWRSPEREILSRIKSSVDETPRVIRLRDLSFAFELLAIGTSISAVVFVIEIIAY